MVAGSDGNVSVRVVKRRIEWRGPRPLKMVFRNGVLASDAVVSDDAVTFDGGDGSHRLQLNERLVLREGPLVSTVFSQTPLLRSLVPRKMLDTWERKWRSRGVLTADGREASSGWVIHEVVQWA